MQYPLIDPILLSIGPLDIRWYGTMYVLGFSLVWLLARYRAKQRTDQWTQAELSDLVFYGAMGAVLGGRVGYVLFYNFPVFLQDPLYLFRVWEGGMAFHGGLLGVISAFAYFAHKTQRTFFQVADFLAPMCPLGLGLGRIGNFINMELPGRVSDGAIGFYYTCDSVRGLNPLCVGVWEDVLRHPSALYQATVEGLLLFLLVWWYSSKPRAVGQVSGVFLVGYGLGRSITELFRSPDSHIGFILFDGVTMGQMLSLPMIIAGIVLIFANQLGLRQLSR